MAPFASEKQRRFMHMKHPQIAKKWDAEGKDPAMGMMRLKAAQKRRRKKRGA